MVRISNTEASLRFYCELLGLKEVRRIENEAGRFTLIFLTAPDDAARAASEKAPLIELTYNWDGDDGLPSDSRHFGHLAYGVSNIHDTCAHLAANGVVIARPPRDGRMAFVRSPDNVSVELLQIGEALVPVEPWASMPSTGHW